MALDRHQMGRGRRGRGRGSGVTNRRAENALKTLIQSETEKLQDEYGADDEYDPDDSPDHGPEYSRNAAQEQEERVIDALLASVPSSKGYYMKIHKEIGPGQYEYKLRINEYETWSDFEYEIANLVQFMTKKDPRKWGTATYRVTIWNEHGMRGDGYQPQFFHVDAGEMTGDPNANGGLHLPPGIDPGEAFKENVGMFANLMTAMKGFMPQQVNPGDTQKQIADAFTSGMGARQNDASSTTTMVTAMMTAMMTMMGDVMKTANAPKDVTPVKDPTETLGKTIEMMKNMGVIGNQNNQHTFKDTVLEMKAMGIDPFPKPNDMTAQVTQVKAIAGLLQDFMGAGAGGERPGIAEKLVDALIPVLPEVLGNIKGLSDNYIKVQGMPDRPTQPGIPQQQLPPQQQQPQPQERETIMGGISGGRHPGNENPQPPAQPQPVDDQAMMYANFFKRFMTAIQTQDQNFFPELVQIIQNSQGGDQLMAAIIQNTITPEQLVNMVQGWGGAEFSQPMLQPQLLMYVRTFMTWLQQQAQRQAEQQQREHGIQTIPLPPIQPTPNPQWPSQPQQEPQPQHSQPQVVNLDMVLAKCSKCGTEYEYNTQADLDNEKDTCEVVGADQQRCGGGIVKIEDEEEVTMTSIN